jgi:hypothetical protein
VKDRRDGCASKKKYPFPSSLPVKGEISKGKHEKEKNIRIACHLHDIPINGTKGLFERRMTTTKH